MFHNTFFFPLVTPFIFLFFHSTCYFFRHTSATHQYFTEKNTGINTPETIVCCLFLLTSYLSSVIRGDKSSYLSLWLGKHKVSLTLRCLCAAELWGLICAFCTKEIPIKNTVTHSATHTATHTMQCAAELWGFKFAFCTKKIPIKNTASHSATHTATHTLQCESYKGLSLRCTQRKYQP